MSDYEVDQQELYSQMREYDRVKGEQWKAWDNDGTKGQTDGQKSVVEETTDGDRRVGRGGDLRTGPVEDGAGCVPHEDGGR